jgi:hypothetical protein
MKPLALTPVQQHRLEKLAQEAGRTPAEVLKFVLRDGFDFCEWEVRETRAADEDVKRKETIPHEWVQREARRIIDAARSRKSRKGA